MKKVLLISAGLIFIGNYLSAQVIGDYRSIGNGNWGTIATWQRYNGTGFVAATEYPGQSTGTGQVTILNGDAVILDVSPAFPIGSLVIEGGNGSSSLAISNGFILNVTGGILISPATGSANTKSIVLNGGTAQLTAASLTLVPSNNDNKTAFLQFNGGVVTIAGNVTMSIALPQRTLIQFVTTGTLNVAGNVEGGEIIPGNGTINFNGTGIQTIGGATTITLHNVGMNNASSTLQLGGNLNVAGTLSLNNGKINTQANTLTLTNATPASQLSGGSSSSYVYSTGVGRLTRNGLAAATSYNFPVGTSAYYMPVTVTPTTVSNFAVNVFSPASTTGVEGGPAFSDKSTIVDAVWNIDRPVGTGNATIIIQWEDALEGSSFTNYGNTDIGVSRFAGSWLPATADNANSAANTVQATFNAFSPFGVGLIGVALPVKFGPLKAYEKQNGIQLEWKVYSEDIVKNYEVERSADARSFSVLGSLPALYNNSIGGDYDFFDANPLPGVSFYRIKNYDLDGKSSFSQVIRVNRDKTIKGLSLYPNPVSNGIVLLQGSDLRRGNYKINIFGANGQEIFRQQISHNGGTISQSIELPVTISKGVYMLSMKDENGNIIFKEKLVTQ